MTFASGSPDPARLDEIRSEVDAVLSSQIFGRSPSLAQFLSYVCRKALAGEANQIKEYNIAVEAFGREADFDQKEDAIVRVEAHRLRKRLKLYYDTEGAGHPFQIVIPAGQYAPQFVEKSCLAPPVELVRAETAEVLPPEPVPGSGERPPVALLPAPRPRKPWTRIAVVALGILLVALAVVRLTRSTPGDTQPRIAASTQAPLAVASDDDAIRIAAGAASDRQVDSYGNVWLGDRYCTGGTAATSQTRMVHRARDAFLYQRRREGDFRYDIPLKPGVYELHLHFAEPLFGAGNLAGGGETSRLFHVTLNDRPLLEYFDILSDAGGANTADVKVFKDVSPASDGYLHLKFTPQKEIALVNGIVILPGIPGHIRPVRIAAGDANVRDHLGNVWHGDRFVAHGQFVVRPQSVSGTADPQLYQGERFGNFSYSIPVAPGRYTVNLKFSESWFGPEKPAGGGAGSRVFDVHCNGATLLKDLDVFQAAGGSNRAVERSFRGLTPNAQDKLVLSFVPVRNYAMVNAIEIVSEQK